MRGAAALSVCLGLAAAQPVLGQTFSTYGSPGLVELPTAQVMPDGQVALTTNAFGNVTRSTFTFQVLPRVHGSFRYSVLRNFRIPTPTAPEDFFDRSFDIHVQLAYETTTQPGVAVGLRDFGGTGLLSSEYVAVTKTVWDKFTFTGGLGWGRLAQRGDFRNPLSYIADRFENRAAVGGLNNTGQLDFGAWFRGPSALFGGVEYRATDRLSFQMEYTPDAYNDEVERNLVDIATPINVGLNYSFPSGSNLRAFVIGGREVGLQYSYTFNPKNRRSPGGLEEAPQPIVGRQAATLADMRLSDRQALSEARQMLAIRLADEGIELNTLTVDGPRATVRIENFRWDVEAQAIGRVARAMARTLPSNISTFVIIPQVRGVSNSAVTLKRDDLETLAVDYDGAWRSLARSRIEDAPTLSREGEVEDRYPRFAYGLGPYLAFSFFDPDEPLRFDVGAELSFSYVMRPGLSFDGIFRQPLSGTIADATRRSNSILQRVRSDAVRYAQESEFEVNRLTAEYMFRPGEDLFGRVTGGYLENMYAGLSGEILWYPIDSQIAFGVEVNYAKQRDFDMLLGLQDYDVITGHASAYFDLGNGFTTQVDAGRYLAGDWGATLGIDREFNNGFKVGGFFTLTDVPFDEFGEGSFDKGIRFSIPISWLTGQPSRGAYSEVIRPILRDGGARLLVANRLYGVARDYRAQGLSDGWGRFYR